MRKIVRHLKITGNKKTPGTKGQVKRKLKPSVARIITFVTNLSRSKIQCCKSAKHYKYNW